MSIGLVDWKAVRTCGPIAVVHSLGGGCDVDGFCVEVDGSGEIAFLVGSVAPRLVRLGAGGAFLSNGYNVNLRTSTA